MMSFVIEYATVSPAVLESILWAENRIEAVPRWSELNEDSFLLEVLPLFEDELPLEQKALVFSLLTPFGV